MSKIQDFIDAKDWDGLAENGFAELVIRPASFTLNDDFFADFLYEKDMLGKALYNSMMTFGNINLSDVYKSYGKPLSVKALGAMFRYAASLRNPARPRDTIGRIVKDHLVLTEAFAECILDPKNKKILTSCFSGVPNTNDLIFPKDYTSGRFDIRKVLSNFGSYHVSKVNLWFTKPQTKTIAFGDYIGTKPTLDDLKYASLYFDVVNELGELLADYPLTLILDYLAAIPDMLFRNTDEVRNGIINALSYAADKWFLYNQDYTMSDDEIKKWLDVSRWSKCVVNNMSREQLIKYFPRLGLSIAASKNISLDEVVDLHKKSRKYESVSLWGIVFPTTDELLKHKEMFDPLLYEDEPAYVTEEIWDALLMAHKIKIKSKLPDALRDIHSVINILLETPHLCTPKNLRYLVDVKAISNPEMYSLLSRRFGGLGPSFGALDKVISILKQY